MNTKEKGKKGEQFFTNKLLLPFFYGGEAVESMRTGERIYLDDITSNGMEGDYKIIDGTINGGIVEVKTNYGRYNNLPIEISEGNYNGWYQHCKEKNVDFLVHNRYRDEIDTCPAYSILIFFPKLAEYIDEKSQNNTWKQSHIKRTKDQISSRGIARDYQLYVVDYLDELIYDAQCCMRIAYPKGRKDNSCMTLKEIMGRSRIPDRYYFRADPIIIPID